MSIAAMVDQKVIKQRRLNESDESEEPKRAARVGDGGDEEHAAKARKKQGPKGAATRRRRRESTTRAGEAVTALATFIPVEAISAYLLLLPFVDPGQKNIADLSARTWTGHWVLAAAVALLTVVYTLLYRLLASKEASSTDDGAEWKDRLKGLLESMPWFALFISLTAFAAWVFAIPDSPFNDAGFYTPELGGAVGTAAATLIATVGAAFGYAGAVRPAADDEET